MNDGKTLVFIPTYNEKENAEKICSEIIGVGLDLDILFLDDNSSDGTGAIIDRLSKKYKNVTAIHRPGKLGIGSAHSDGIKWAYAHGYKTLITMDCDFAHSPSYLAGFIENSKNYDIVIGSRYIMKNSLKGWNLIRRFLTSTGHFLTKYCLGIEYDATGAFRLYRLDRIPVNTFDLVRSKGYSFFFESIYILNINGFSIKELPIILPPRTYGHSKMNYKEAIHSFNRLVRIYLGVSFNKKQYEIDKGSILADKSIVKKRENEWDGYWESKNDVGGLLYDVIAAFYRKYIIQPSLNHFIKKYFADGSGLLHAGCGSGQVDTKINKRFSITALDHSVPALNIYKRFNKDNSRVVHGDILNLPFKENTFDGIYNLGVLEHFREEEILNILSQFHRVLKPDGKIVIFWPPKMGASVLFFRFMDFVSRNIFKKKVNLYPEEISILNSKSQADYLCRKANFKIIDFYFGIRDCFTYAVVVAQKQRPREGA